MGEHNENTKDRIYLVSQQFVSRCRFSAPESLHRPVSHRGTEAPLVSRVGVSRPSRFGLTDPLGRFSQTHSVGGCWFTATQPPGLPPGLQVLQSPDKPTMSHKPTCRTSHDGKRSPAIESPDCFSSSSTSGFQAPCQRNT